MGAAVLRGDRDTFCFVHLTPAQEAGFQIVLTHCPKEERGRSRWKSERGAGEGPAARHTFYFILFIFCLFPFSRAVPAAYGGSQARVESEL